MKLIIGIRIIKRIIFKGIVLWCILMASIKALNQENIHTQLSIKNVVNHKILEQKSEVRRCFYISIGIYQERVL